MKDDIVKVMFAYAFNLSDTFKRSNFRNRFSLKVVLKPLSNTKKVVIENNLNIFFYLGYVIEDNVENIDSAG